MAKQPNPRTLAILLAAIDRRYPGATKKPEMRKFATKLARDIDRLMQCEIVEPVLRQLLKEAFNGNG
jgi:hypothetical protein